MLTFVPPYNKPQFYQLMGPFFSERYYRNKFPYLINSNRTRWYIVIDQNSNVQAFASYEVKNTKIEIGEVYVSEDIRKENMKQLLIRKVLLDIRSDFPGITICVSTDSEQDRDLFERKGFTLVRETKNYFFLRNGEGGKCCE